MTDVQLFVGLGLLLWLLGLHAVMTHRHTIHRLIAINVSGSGVFLVMVSLASRGEGVDPVMQALVVTGLVVAVCATAFALRLGSARQQSHDEAESPS
ncbi:NADH-quinone oxidoreductase subunit K [Saccharospirillum sp.]|uniref:NADH-quinone oxidoreductase subunit K n=1 Tax=Saccharospirillum sp. TaxID=2033801 RepID=UPI0034A09251